jgi:hypothetical protein
VVDVYWLDSWEGGIRDYRPVYSDLSLGLGFFKSLHLFRNNIHVVKMRSRRRFVLVRLCTTASCHRGKYCNGKKDIAIIAFTNIGTLLHLELGKRHVRSDPSHPISFHQRLLMRGWRRPRGVRKSFNGTESPVFIRAPADTLALEGDW